MEVATPSIVITMAMATLFCMPTDEVEKACFSHYINNKLICTVVLKVLTLSNQSIMNETTTAMNKPAQTVSTIACRNGASNATVTFPSASKQKGKIESSLPPLTGKYAIIAPVIAQQRISLQWIMFTKAKI